MVVLRAMISRQGKIENLQVAGGHPLLVESAINAAFKWRYRPYCLNNQPVEVETR
jgi:protein TonB